MIDRHFEIDICFIEHCGIQSVHVDEQMFVHYFEIMHNVNQFKQFQFIALFCY